MSSRPSYTNRAPGAAPPPYVPLEHPQVNKDNNPYPLASMPTPATDITNQWQAATMLDTGYHQPSPGMPVPQPHTTTQNMGSVSSSSYSASRSSKYGTGSRSVCQPVPPEAAQPISTTNYYYQAPSPPAMYVPVITDPAVQGQ